jgi:signal peptide peptidase SppA
MSVPLFWAGSDESYELVVKAQAKVDDLLAKPGMTAGWLEDALAKLPPLWRHEGSTAVVEVNGPVVNGSAGFMRLFGVLGYDDIGQAAVAAATHPDTKGMLYHINTPGGDVAGIVDMSALLGQLSSLKPSAVHTTELMASAGYWMASAIRGAISAGPTAVVGSIGVLRVHTETSKRLEEQGIKATVLRSGEYKAELNSIEPLTEGAKARAQEQLAEVHKLFRKQVAAGRPNLAADQLAEVTKGQTFLGQAAVKAGLVDKVQSFDLALKLLDKQKHSSNTPSNSKGKAMAITLTQDQLTALRAGKSMAEIGLHEDGTPMTAEEIAARDQATADTAAAAELSTLKAELATVKGQLTTVQGELASANTALTAARADVAAANVKVADLQKVAQHHEGLLAIAKEATANMLIPMGGTKAAVDAMDAAGVVAEHARVKPEFLAKFPAGRQSAPNDDDDGNKATKATLPPGFEYALKNAPSANR